MKKQNFILTLLLFCVQTLIFGQSTEALRKQILDITSDKEATVGVFIQRQNDTVSLNADARIPLQSVFKFHIAAMMLVQIDKGKFKIDQKIAISKAEMLPDLYSPIREKYPDGCEMTIGDLIGYTVSQSDNVGCDVMMRLLGGASEIEKYFKKKRFRNISIKINEEIQQKNWDLQFQNWTTPRSANEVLRAFFYNKRKLLSSSSHDFLWKVMRETSTGKKRLVNQLPTGTIVAHKTGSSGTKNGITAAVHDFGIVFLPNGEPIFITVFVSNSTENNETNEKIIADIAKVTWDFFTQKTK